MTIDILCCSTGGGSSGPDRFAPTIVVGNVPRGDSAVAYSQDGFTYIPDPGDGTGIAAAIAALNSPGPIGGSIHIRRGIYDFNEPTSPALPLRVNGWVNIQGDGDYATQIYTPYTGVPTLFRIGGAAPDPIGRGVTIGNMYVYSYHEAGGVYPPGMSPGIIDFDEPLSFGYAKIHDFRAEAEWYDPLAPLRSFFSVRSGHTVIFERCNMLCTTPALGGEGDWHRAWSLDGAGGNMSITIRDCEVNGFDAAVVVGTGRLVAVENLLVTAFTRRYVHQLTSDNLCRVTINGGYGLANDAGAIGLNLHSHQDANVKVTNLSLVGAGDNQTNPAVQIRSAVNAGHAQFTNCTFEWQRPNGAAFEIGTSGSNNPCARNSIVNCHIHNGQTGSVALRIFNATAGPAAGSRNNIIVANSLEAATGLVDDNPGANQVALNV
ncbi:MAG: hypothetical protein ACRCSL_04740 [Microbacterium sp.]